MPLFRPASSPSSSSTSYASKWATFSAATLILLVSGGMQYSFSLYAGDLKHKFHLSQTGLAGLGTALNVGAAGLALPAGLFYDSMVARGFDILGPFATLAVGAALHFIGYGSLAAALQKSGGEGENGSTKNLMSYPLLALSCAVGASAQAWLDTALLATVARNLPSDRGAALGTLKAAAGLCSAVWATLYLALGLDGPHFLAAAAVFPPMAVLLLGRAVNVVPFLQKEALAKSHAFHLAFTSLVGIAAYTAVVAAAARRRSGGSGGGSGGGPAPPPSSLPSFDDVDGLLIGGALALLALPLAAIAPIFGGFWAVKASAASGAAAAEAEAAAGGPPPAPPPELVPFQESGARAASRLSRMLSEGGRDGDGEGDMQQRRRLGSPLLSLLNGGSGGNNAATDNTLRGGNGAFSQLLVQDAFGDKTPLKTLRSVSFWLFFAAYSTGCGAGLTLINNAAALAGGGGGGGGGGKGPVDPGPDDPTTPTTTDLSGLLFFGGGSPVFGSPTNANNRDAVPLVVALFSIASCLGRLAAGRVPDKLLRGPSRVPRTVPFAALVAASGAAAALASAVPPPRSGSSGSVAYLGAAAVAAGAAYGGLQGIAPAVVSEVFGLRHFGANLALAAGAPALGSYVFATLISGKLYERARRAAEAAGGTCSRDRRHGGGSGGHGEEKEVFACFRGPLLAAAAAAGVLGLSAAVALALRTRRLYSRVAAVAAAQRAARGRLGEELAARRDSLRAARAEAALLRSAVCRAAPLVEELAASVANSPSPSESAAGAAKRLSEELSRLSEETRRLLSRHDEHVAAVGDWGRRALAGGGGGGGGGGGAAAAAAAAAATTTPAA